MIIYIFIYVVQTIASKDIKIYDIYIYVINKLKIKQIEQTVIQMYMRDNPFYFAYFHEIKMVKNIEILY